MKEGREEGREEERREVALNLLREGMVIEGVARVTRLSIAQLQQFQAEASQDAEAEV